MAGVKARLLLRPDIFERGAEVVVEAVDGEVVDKVMEGEVVVLHIPPWRRVATARTKAPLK